jgi:peptidyl-prolyl cis-trans isomerase C
MNRPLLLLGTLALVAAAGCSSSSTTGAAAVKEDNVAVVDGKPISRNTFNQYAKGAAGKPAEDLTPEQRKDLLENLIRGQVVAETAETTGLAARDETRAVLELSRLTILQQAVSENYLKDRKPSEEELRAEYDLQVAGMDRTQYRASHILVPTEELAKQIISQLGAGASFAALARQSSIDSGSKERGGDLDWFAPASMTPPFGEAVRKMKKGETTAVPVKTQFGWHVIRILDTREASPPPFEGVKDRLVQFVEAKKFKAYTDGLVAKAKVTKTL